MASPETPRSADVLAVIPYYKRADQLEKCLAAIAASGVPVEAYVHDNNTVNAGFTRACNLGLGDALRRGHRWAILLNQDCYLRPDAVAKAIAFMEAHPRCAIAGVKQVAGHDQDLIVHGGCTAAYPAGRHLHGRVSNGDCAVDAPMPWVNGACMFVRMEAVPAIGLMDESYFLIASDSDWCFEARARGWEVWYCASAVVVHETTGVSRRQTNLESAAAFQEDQAYFRRKWVGSSRWELLQEPPATGPLPNASRRELLERGTTHHRASRADAAELCYLRLLEHNPDDLDVVLLLGQLYLQASSPALGARLIKRVSDARPDDGALRGALADALAQSALYELAVEQYERAIALTGEAAASPAWLNNYGVVLAELGRIPEARALWQQALARNPALADARTNLARFPMPRAPS